MQDYLKLPMIHGKWFNIFSDIYFVSKHCLITRGSAYCPVINLGYNTCQLVLISENDSKFYIFPVRLATIVYYDPFGDTFGCIEHILFCTKHI